MSCIFLLSLVHNSNTAKNVNCFIVAISQLFVAAACFRKDCFQKGGISLEKKSPNRTIRLWKNERIPDAVYIVERRGADRGI